MLPVFSIDADPSRRLIAVTVGGFYTMDALRRFERAYRDAHARLACPPNEHLSLVDTSAMHIQSQDVVAAFADIARDPAIRSRRLAFVVGASLARQQTRRLIEPDRQGVGFFRDRAAAEAWLFAGALNDDRTASRYRHEPASPRSGGRDCTDRSAA